MVDLWVPLNGRPMGNNKKIFSGGERRKRDKGRSPSKEGLVATTFVNFYFNY